MDLDAQQIVVSCSADNKLTTILVKGPLLTSLCLSLCLSSSCPWLTFFRVPESHPTSDLSPRDRPHSHSPPLDRHEIQTESRGRCGIEKSPEPVVVVCGGLGVGVVLSRLTMLCPPSPSLCCEQRTMD
jgi:hypothetical protein